jgi:hypothetical protein
LGSARPADRRRRAEVVPLEQFVLGDEVVVLNKDGVS